ncbi:predicted phage protein [Salmonella enterica subsp. enterica serovar Enteritidis str. P125109]|uniref:Predicted phage protein n=2 Tax=Salmonella enteritidis TaxID=149539 RepID=A0A6C7HQ18_SALEP|nr:hypothetical protein A673_04274 [Salmonella enterica subsp. enterica serovar Enteritidis str. 2009K0958]EPI65924.1 hypothetical protein A672_04198 [Salmonella enterica subsp. enterica serovar Enteritidis str. 08-1080]EPI79813.1 hypothetical protein A676_04255 [Salmonella enterica subsp. enterica serovar Enteritidis str. 2010K-0262]EPI81457.1 hypothetical protein A675_04088 [Salmonella enterica subsp. enterica serovar Enteritidis str. 2009K1726]EPI81702.1 hypothetical protein A674_04286 [Salm
MGHKQDMRCVYFRLRVMVTDQRPSGDNSGTALFIEVFPSAGVTGKNVLPMVTDTYRANMCFREAPDTSTVFPVDNYKTCFRY